MTEFKLRPAQEEIVRFRQGKMGILAVPGSGKTWTLSYLAAELLSKKVLARGQEILIVTLVNSAVDIFTQRIRLFLEARGLIPLDFRVRTLHGLAHDIVRERPELVGLDERFQILDERESDRICAAVTQSWLKHNYAQMQPYLDQAKSPELNRNFQQQFPEYIQEVASSFISLAKDRRLSPADIRLKLDQTPIQLPLLEMGWAIYHDYQRALQYRGAVDFSDLIRLAYDALEWDPQLLQRLQQRWPYILEDEAQDSNLMQEKILRKLVGEHGNWVRVGDPNQAIYETFTTANPRYLRQFVEEEDVIRRELPNSGRSTLSIIALANELIRWTMEDHPLEEVQDALQAPPYITPLPPTDIHQNPADDPSKIFLHKEKLTPEKEIQIIVRSLKNWLKDHADQTVAVLVPRADRGLQLVEKLKEEGIPFEDSLLKTTSTTRQTARMLGDILAYLAEPTSSKKLAKVYQTWRLAMTEMQELDSQATELEKQQIEEDTNFILKCKNIEEFLYPSPHKDYLASITPQETAGVANENAPLINLLPYQRLERFRQIVRRWQEAVLIPIDQLLLTLAQDLFHQPADLALVHKLAIILRQAQDAHPNWHLQELAQELTVISNNQRRFIGFGKNDLGFNPEDYKGVVVVSTMHKAKGLEWDRVYLLSVNNYDFPSGASYDQYQSEKWFLRDRLNLQAEVIAQLEWLIDPTLNRFPVEHEATEQARLDYIRERIRLLYVGITRAKKELIITWNSGRNNQQPAYALQALWNYWDNKYGRTSS
ncbi:MAG: ATP-dependent helicase [Anaerolineales bacterium]